MSTTRQEPIDALRGLAMVWMTAFHLGFDLQHFGFWSANVYQDPVWTTQRTAIVSLFLLCAGWGQAVAVEQGQSWARFWRRWGRIVAASGLVTLGSYLMFPASFIYFGILHGMALMLLLTRSLLACAPRTWLLVTLGGLALALPLLAPWLHGAWPAAEALNHPALNWLGWISRKPITEDYAPLFPWWGVMLWGAALARPCQRFILSGPGSLPATLRPLAHLGRWSLSYYLLHQPVLIGLLWLLGFTQLFSNHLRLFSV